MASFTNFITILFRSSLIFCISAVVNKPNESILSSFVCLPMVSMYFIIITSAIKLSDIEVF